MIVIGRRKVILTYKITVSCFFIIFFTFKKFCPEDNPLKYKDERIDRALGTLLNAGFKDERVQFLLEDICLALALRGRIEYFYKIKECIESSDQIYTKREILLYLTYLALQSKGNYLSELEGMLERYLKGTDIKKEEVILSIWAADFKQFKARLEEIATSGPGDYEDKKNGGRYHMTRKVCALWNEEDLVTRYKLWIAFALKDYRITMKNPACKLRFEEELSGIASRLTRNQKDEILTFIDYCYRETTDERDKKSTIWEIVRNKIK